MIGTIATRIGGQTDDHAEHATTPEAPELQAALRAMVDAGDRGGGHRDDVARARARPRGRRRLRRRDPDERHPRASRAPRDVGGVSRRQAVAVRPPAAERAGSRSHGRCPRRRSSTSTTRRPALFVGTARDAGARVITYGTEPAADIRATRVSEDAGGLHAEIVTPDGEATLDLRLAGRFNVHNALAVVALGEALGLDPERVAGRAGGLGGRARPDGTDRPRPAVRRRRRLRAQPGVADDGPRPARPGAPRRAAAGSSRSSGRPASGTRPNARRWDASPASVLGSSS